MEEKVKQKESKEQPENLDFLQAKQKREKVAIESSPAKKPFKIGKILALIVIALLVIAILIVLGFMILG